MDGEVGGMIIRSLRAGDCGRLVEMDLRLTGRSRKAWFEGKLGAQRDADLEKQGFVPAPRKVLEISLGSGPAMSEDENELQAGALTPEFGSPPRPRSG